MTRIFVEFLPSEQCFEAYLENGILLLSYLYTPDTTQTVHLTCHNFDFSAYSPPLNQEEGRQAESKGPLGSYCIPTASLLIAPAPDHLH